VQVRRRSALADAGDRPGRRPIMMQALRAQTLLAERGIAAEIWSAPSYQLLRNEALEADHWNRCTRTSRSRRRW
jgi:pyruvate dehydrogenase complex dehydrogenase (E1) component